MSKGKPQKEPRPPRTKTLDERGREILNLINGYQDKVELFRTARERDIVFMRLGIGYTEPLTFKKISDEFLVSIGRISQICAKAFRIIKNRVFLYEKEKEREKRLFECIEKAKAGNKDLDILMNISEFNFSTKTNNCLTGAGITTIYDLINFKDINRIRNLGYKSYCEIVDKLNTLGLYLRDPKE